MPGFVHLHVHSSYSLLEGALTIARLAELAKADRQPALALTDTDNMFGALEFSDKMAGAGIQPIVGCALAMVTGFVLGDPGTATGIDLVWLALFGALTMGLGMAMFTVGARRIPSAQAALLGALETPLAPLWVWLAFNEVPSVATFIGGGLILAALVWHFAHELRGQDAAQAGG